MKVGVGYEEEQGAFQCGRNIAERAVESGDITKAALIYTFCTESIEVQEYILGLQSVVGDNVPIVGGNAVGVFTNSGLSYEKSAAAALIIQTDEPVRTGFVTDIDRDAETSGRELARQLGVVNENKMVLFLYDLIKSQKMGRRSFVLNSALELLKGFFGVREIGAPLFGAGLVGSLDFSHSTLFSEKRCAQNSALGILFGGELDVFSVSMHGCAPFDGQYHTITKKRGDAILELDGTPAANMIDEIYQSREWRDELPVKELTIARNLGEKYESFRERNYINRMIAGPTKTDGLVIPDLDWRVGDDVQFMIRDSREMMESAQKNSRELLQRIKRAGKKPAFGIYIDCVRRTSIFSNSLYDEASLVQKVFNEFNVPLLGFYSGIELTTVSGRCMAREWTGSLVVVTHSKG